jgi:RHS repeat-associated protein
LDASGRVTTVTGAQWSERYAYDPAGNITSATWPSPPPGVRAPWLESDPQGTREVTGTLISRAGNIRYRHDAAGRVIARTRTRISRKPETWRYEWDADNRLVAATVPGGTTWRYRYDPLGRRVAKQHVSASGEVLEETRFIWDGAVLAEQVETITASDTSGAREHVREQVTTWDYHPGTFTPLAQAIRTSLRDAPQEVIDERFYAIITDLAGTPCELVTPDGTLAGYQQRTLWGNTLWHPSGEETPLRFPGQYADPETGLHYNNQRYYDPVSGAYLSPDPLGLSPAPNPHAYVDNPHVLIDPLGLAADDSYGTGSSTAEGARVPTFDQARREAFQNAGMTNPNEVTFSKYDPGTGTVVEFKGPDGAKVAYDGPHDNPGPFHDSQHIGWQTGGKRGAPGWGRGNIPYSGPRGPVRGSTPGWEDWWDSD